MIHLATIGTNFITDWLLDAAAHCPEICHSAVYSRSLEKGQAYAQKRGVEKVITDFDALCAARDIDAVYVASPNRFHAPQAIALLKAGKHVLCEKPVALNTQELQEMIAAAQEKGVVFMEAMRPAYAPGLYRVKALLPKLGKIRRVTLQFCQYSSRYDKFKNGIVENAFDPTLGNGALMDIGVYCVHFMELLFGMPQKVTGAATFLPGGLDGQGTLLAQYEDMLCELIYSKITQSVTPSVIQGEEGSLLFSGLSGGLDTVTFRPRKGEDQVFPIALPTGGDMVCEVQAFIRQIQQGRTDGIMLTHSLNATRIMDEARAVMGIDFSRR